MEEADESLYWLEITKATGLMRLTESDQLDRLINEANQLVSIFNAADITAKKNRDGKIFNIIKSKNQQ